MSIVERIVSRLDVNIDKVQLQLIDEDAEQARRGSSEKAYANIPDPNTSIQTINRLKALVQSLSADSKGLLNHRKLLGVLTQTQRSHKDIFYDKAVADDASVYQVVWVFAGKAAAQTLGVILNILLKHLSTIDDEIDYWDGILTSNFYTGYYTLQTAPSRAWSRAYEVYVGLRNTHLLDTRQSSRTVTQVWSQFYQLVQRNVQENFAQNATNAVKSPFARCRTQIREKRKSLKLLKDLNASAIGILLEESFALGNGDQLSDKSTVNISEWRNSVHRSTILMESVLQHLKNSDASLKEFEGNVSNNIAAQFQNEQHITTKNNTLQPLNIIERLVSILQVRIQDNATSTNVLVRQHGRPSPIVRYWIPASSALLSLSTLLRIITSRKAELLTWISEFGATLIDFWGNWVLKPIEDLIGTIRHDEQSEIAIMSRNSLKADQESLERMVVDFVSDHLPSSERSGPDVEMITAQVREGDLTAVLKAYERDLRKPFVGTIRGDLIRALLIQIQKTKVDVEVAVGGIDALLKSQELVFGFVGLTPGILVSYATLRGIGSFLGNRKGFRAGTEKQRIRRAIRNVNRILSEASSTPKGILSYRDYGLFISEAYVMSQSSQYTLPRSVLGDFKQDLADLMDVGKGVKSQMNVVGRIQWMYSRWI
ncbi:ATP synthase regulation protein NCA2-domain-containing protein [Talaromyces proteolyticus]|uniref:ATP synthase regulation protein NCA2-domain-containing protein n=1 Tax=Talaromyces proteolyticus TaxID=1131652 RepID=A0AAD4PVR4_9EURO|nr:ATP synthase regulation protein NCA2-domain-containing protein [Talaromyces proteolyticus]KAH8690983.1 ATP synthase regulation protein NCA2-domain-containing protein [Talaromyces proteolyticus]